MSNSLSAYHTTDGYKWHLGVSIKNRFLAHGEIKIPERDERHNNVISLRVIAVNDVVIIISIIITTVVFCVTIMSRPKLGPISYYATLYEIIILCYVLFIYIYSINGPKPKYYYR